MNKPKIVNWTFAALIVFFLVYTLVDVTVGIDMFSWIALAGVILALLGAVVVIARLSAEQARELTERVNTNPLLKGVFTAVILSAIYGTALLIIYAMLPALPGNFGVEPRTWWVIASIIVPFSIPLLWHLYAATGLPGDVKTIRKGFLGISIAALGYFGWSYYDQPNQFFDPETGNALFLVAEKEGKIYYSPSAADEDTVLYSPVTKEKLRPGTSADAEKYRRESWVKEASVFLPSFSTETVPASSRTQRVTVVLKGENVFTGSVPLPTTGKVYLLGPIASRLRDGYGNVALLNRRHGDLYGPLNFAGPKGDTVFVDLVP